MGTTGDCNHQWNRLTRSQRISVRNSELTTEIIGNPLNSVEVLCIFISFSSSQAQAWPPAPAVPAPAAGSAWPKTGWQPWPWPAPWPNAKAKARLLGPPAQGCTVGTVVVQAKKKEDEDPTVAISKYLSGVLRHNAVAGPRNQSHKVINCPADSKSLCLWSQLPRWSLA
jgi:hypothetical protein